MSLYDVDLAESHPAGALLLSVIAAAMRDVEQRRCLGSAARFLLGPALASYADALGLDDGAVRARALRLCPDLPKYFADAVEEPARRGGPPRRERCKRGHSIEVDARGKRYCAQCRRDHRREYMRRIRRLSPCTTVVP